MSIETIKILMQVSVTILLIINIVLLHQENKQRTMLEKIWNNMLDYWKEKDNDKS